MTRDDKPLELPGFYWDEERHRYFPITSRPKRKTVDDEPTQTKTVDANPAQPLQHCTSTTKYIKSFRRGTDTHSQKSRIFRELEGRSLVNSYTELDPPVRPLAWQTTKITSFHAATVEDTLNVLVGDSRGVLHCSRSVIRPSSEAIAGPDRFNDNSRLFTSYHLGAGGAVSHIARSGNIAIGVSSTTCNSCALGIRDLTAPDFSGVSFPRINVAGDIRAVNLLDKSLALGASKSIVWSKDITGPLKGYRIFKTQSDVLSVIQSSNTITTGLRNGIVRLFDVRARGDASSELLGARFSKRDDSVSAVKTRYSHSSITHLQNIGEWELLVGTSAGELELFDLRFAAGSHVQPTMSFKGHVNSYLLDLGITTDPSSSFLFAAGQDHRIRAWSLRTGEYIGTLLGGSQLCTPARALAVTQTDRSRWLWIPQEDEVRVVRLGG